MPVSADAVTRSVHDLPGHGRIRVTEQVRPTGAVAYQITGPDPHGSIVLKPDVADDQAVPDRLVVQLGDGEHLLATHLSDLPTVHGVPLIGGGHDIDLDDPCWPHRLRIRPLHATDPTESTGLTAAVGCVVAVCGLLAERYRRLDTAALMSAAARSTAAARLRRVVHQRILPLRRLLVEARADLAAAWSLAEALQQLSPLALLDQPAEWAGRLPGVDPETYISADDDGDWLTCPRCQQPTVMIAPGDSLAGLLTAHAAHTCPPNLAG